MVCYFVTVNSVSVAELGYVRKILIDNLPVFFDQNWKEN